MTDKLDLDALEALEKAATPGPWVACTYSVLRDIVFWIVESADSGRRVDTYEIKGNDWRLNIAARNALPELIRRARLLDEVRELVADIGRRAAVNDNVMAYTVAKKILGRINAKVGATKQHTEECWRRVNNFKPLHADRTMPTDCDCPDVPIGQVET